MRELLEDFALVRKAALLGAIPPFLLKTGDNPGGVDQAVFDGIKFLGSTDSVVGRRDS